MTHPLPLLRRRATLALAIVAAALSGCASVQAPPAAPAGPPLVPPAAMRVEGVPTLSQAVLGPIQRYSQVVGHGVVDWHPQRREMLVAHRLPGSSTTQIFRLRSPLGALEPLTDSPDPVSNARWEPTLGRSIVFTRGTGGDEVFQLFRLDPETRVTTQITPSGQRHAFGAWVPAAPGQASRVLYTSVPIDRTAQGGSRASINTTLSIVDPADPAGARVVTELPGGGWFGVEVSPDGRQAAITHYVSATRSEVWLIDLANGQRRQLLPAAGENVTASHFAGGWSADGQALFVVSDRASEFRELMRLDMATPAPAGLKRLTAQIPWDVEDGNLAPASGLLALTANVDGRDELRLFDAITGAERALPAGTRLPVGSVGSLRTHPASGELAMVISGAKAPAQVVTLNPKTGAVETWTQPVTPAGLDLAELPDPEIVRWQSFDGRTISGILYLPPARFTGRRPVYMLVHGGPEAQSKLGWKGRLNYLTQEMGIAVFEPNVRGSSGYGKTFLNLDNGRLREDSVKDMGTAIDWMATHPRLDAKRVVVGGGSYGGYMALAASVRLADRIAGAAATVGISNFVTFLERTESYRRDLRRVEYGDERDPAMRAFLESISPLNLADQIRKPLLVVQGKNDPRVPWTESEQIVRKLQARNSPVWYLLADNEGHGFARRENADFHFATLVRFLQDTVLK
jgi:dipeptidyl aminopeptidase/acylaminoacyl peptidase